jgi:predicted phage terminase large subunit-like protein
VIEENLVDFWERSRDKKYITESVDRVRYTTIQICLENGWHFIDEERPRSGKTEAVGVFSVAWWLATHPNFKFGFITHSQSLGNKFLAEVARLLREMGFEFEYERANEFKLKGSAGIDPSFWVSGIAGGHTGKGCHRLIISDVLRSGTDAMSQKIRESIITDVISTGMNRLEPYTADGGTIIPGAVTLEQARLHDGDPVGWFLSESHLPYVQHHYPAINDDGHSAWVKNTYTGEVFFAQPYEAVDRRVSRAQLNQIKTYSTAYYWNCQYLMVCGLGELVYYDLTRCKRYEHTPQVDVWWFAGDFANTATVSGSRSALCAMGYTESTGQLSVLGAEAGRWRADEMGDRMIAFLNAIFRQTGLRPEAVLVERAASGYGIIDRYQSTLPIVPIIPTGSKEDRAGAVCYIVNQGGVALPAEAPWLKEWEAEVGGFPLATLNDAPDAFTHCLSYASRPSEFRPKPVEYVVMYDALAADGPASAWDEMNRFDASLAEAEAFIRGRQ